MSEFVRLYQTRFCLVVSLIIPIIIIIIPNGSKTTLAKNLTNFAVNDVNSRQINLLNYTTKLNVSQDTPLGPISHGSEEIDKSNSEEYQVLHQRIPYQVSILVNGSRKCEGAIIDLNLILTVAHCLNNVQNPQDELQVVIGQYNSLYLNRHEKTLPVDAILVHPRGHVVNSSVEEEREYDLAVLRTQGMKFKTTFVNKINIMSTSQSILDENENLIGRSAYVTDRGYVADHFRDENVRQTELKIVGFQQCEEAFPQISRQNLSDTMLCAQAVSNKSQSLTSCNNMDTGSALVLRPKYPVTSNTLIGLLSFRPCKNKLTDTSTLPGLYTDVPKHRNWIDCSRLLSRGTHTIFQINEIFKAKGQCDFCLGYICPNTFKCLNSSLRCNGKDDCGDFSDENPQFCLNNNHLVDDEDDSNLWHCHFPQLIQKHLIGGSDGHNGNCFNLEQSRSIKNFVIFYILIMILIIIFIIWLTTRWCQLSRKYWNELSNLRRKKFFRKNYQRVNDDDAGRPFDQNGVQTFAANTTTITTREHEMIEI